MSGWETQNCVNHPDRIAVERCEVCRLPLCAFCLYYTQDGQRLCAYHAEQARQAGMQIEAPGTYSEQLVSAQAGVVSKHKRELQQDDGLYKGNSHDLVALIGALIGLITLGSCCGGVYCLPIVALVLSVVALINAKNAYDPKRTRKLGIVGMLVSGIWVAAIVGCIVIYAASFSQLISAVSTPYYYPPSVFPFGGTATLTTTPTDTPAPTRDSGDVDDVPAAFVIERVGTSPIWR